MRKVKDMTILIVEDDDGHAELIKEALNEAGVCNNIIRFSDGEEAWIFMNNDENYHINESNKAFLVLLDINMPRMDGVELLKLMKSDDNLKEIPVIMLTTTDDPREITECYKIGCNFYITKPVDFIKFTETLKRLGLFIQVVKF